MSGTGGSSVERVRAAQAAVDELRRLERARRTEASLAADLTARQDAERDAFEEFFVRDVYPVLTPLAVDPAHPFPYISGLSLNLAVTVRETDSGQEHFARVKVPPLLPRMARSATASPSATRRPGA